MVPLNLTIDQRSSVPLYEQICQQIRRRIESSELQPGAVLPTNHQLRDRLQVNYKTAQQAMATLAREGYVTRQARRGTIVKGIPVRGVVAIYAWIELFGPDSGYEFYRLLTSYLSKQLESAGRVYRLYLGSEPPGKANTADEDLLRHAVAGSLSGALLLNIPQRLPELKMVSQQTRLPMVSFYGGEELDYSAGVDYFGFLRNAAAFLRSQGRRRVGLIFSSDSIGMRNPDLVSCAMAESGLEVNPAWIKTGHDNEQGGYDAASQMPWNELDGLILTDDVMAMGVDHRLTEANVSVPANLKAAVLWIRGSRLHPRFPFERFEYDPEWAANSGLRLLQAGIDGHRVAQPHVRLVPSRSTVQPTGRVPVGASVM